MDYNLRDARIINQDGKYPIIERPSLFPVKSQNDAAAILKAELHITGSEAPDYSVNTTTTATLAALDTTTGMYLYDCICICLIRIYIYNYTIYSCIYLDATTSTTTAAVPDTSKHPPDIYSSPTQRGKQLQFQTPPTNTTTGGVKNDSFSAPSGSLLHTVGSRKSPERIANEANSAVQAAIAAAVDPTNVSSKQPFEPSFNSSKTSKDPSAPTLKNQVRQLSKHFGLAMRQTSAVMYRSLRGSGLRSSGYG